MYYGLSLRSTTWKKYRLGNAWVRIVGERRISIRRRIGEVGKEGRTSHGPKFSLGTGIHLLRNGTRSFQDATGSESPE